MVDLENFMVIEDAHAHSLHVEKKNLKTERKRTTKLVNRKIRLYPSTSVKTIYSDLCRGG